MRLSYKILFISAFAAISCERPEGCTDPLALNYDENAEKNCCCEYAPVLNVPSTYVFEDDNGNNTVSYNGQQQRLEMLSEMANYLKTANTAGTSLDATILKNMYSNSGYSWIDAPTLGMTGSSKQLKDKTAGGDVGVQLYFENLMDSIAALSTTTTLGNEDGTAGVGGVWPNDGVKGPYLMNADGQEYMQYIEKGLMCAVFYYQMTHYYLGNIATDDNTTAVDPANGRHYTEMEHHWDEAYGYFTSEIDFPTNGTDRFWGKYANNLSLLGSATKIAEAFRRGRAAIVADNYTERDAQVNIINVEMEKVCAGTAIHYLNSAKNNLANNTTRNHVLSEAWAFIDGLRYGERAINGTGMTTTHIDMCLNMLGTDFNNITLTQINNVIDHVAMHTGLTDVKDNL